MTEKSTIGIVQAQVDALQTSYYDSLKDVYEKFNVIENALAEMRKTIFASTSTLANEVFEGRKEFKDYRENEIVDRAAGRKRNNIKDIVIGAIGCFVVLIGCCIIVVLFIALWLLWYRGII